MNVGSQQPIYTAESDANGKINIHVSVVIVKSLSDLKKQRSQSRHTTPGQADGNGNGLPVPITAMEDNELTAGDFHRFSGNTSDIIGDNQANNRCCNIM